jgi:aminoglycoside/choline kinase family phosphotransferase
MKVEPSLEQQVIEIFKSNSKFAGITAYDSKMLKADGSGRVFSRLNFTSPKIKSAVLMQSPLGLGPKLAGDQSYPQEKAFVELCQYFSAVGVPTPTYYGSNAEKSLVLLEDVGDLALFQVLKADSAADMPMLERLFNECGQDLVKQLFKKAISIIKSLQTLPEEPKIICFRRFLAFENYRAEIQEYSDFFAESRGIKKSELLHLSKIYDHICEELDSFPRKLAHFDFNAHNLFVSDSAELRVLDFQDACFTSPARDIVSLINDRGMNELLGAELHSSLYKFYKDSLDLGDAFDRIYDLTLLHWDLRVSGRFIKLNQKFETDRYSEWLPSTLRRLAHTLKRMQPSFDSLSDLMEISIRISPEMKEILV